MNFRELTIGTLLGRCADEASMPLFAYDEQGRDVTARYLAIRKGGVRTLEAVTPAMLTVSEQAVRQDCLGYFTERINDSALGV